MKGKRLLLLAGIGMLAFGAAELPALGRMSSHGTSVLGFEFAGSTHRMLQILTRWGSVGRRGAEEHVLIDLGFIACYGLLLAGGCGRLAAGFERVRHRRAAAFAALFAWGAVVAATVNAMQKIVLWLEIHGHTAQPLPALAAAAGTITFILGVPAAMFAIGGTIAARRSRAAVTEGPV